MNHCGTQKPETERLVLRRFTEDDALAMFENRASDSEVTKFLMWQPHSDAEVSKGVIADWNNQGICDACYYALLKAERHP